MNARNTQQNIGPDLSPAYAFDTLIDHPGKLVALGALGLCPEIDLTGVELRNHINELQRGWQFSPRDGRTPFDYCETMSRAGLVTMTEKSSIQGMVAAVRITDRGRVAGLAVVGGALPIAAEPQTPPLYRLFGPTARSRGKEPLKVTLYSLLLNGPEEGLTIPQLHRQTGAASETINTTAKELSKWGVVTLQNSSGPENRLFDLRPLTGRLYRTQMDPKALAVVNILLDLQQRDVTSLTGRDILNHIAERLPGMDRYDAFSSFGRWLRSRKGKPGFVQELTPAPDGVRPVLITLSDTYRTQIEALLDVRQRVATDATYREEMAAHALKLMRQKRLLGAVMAKAYRNSQKMAAAAADPWADTVADLVPTEGIDVRELHRTLCARLGRELGYKSFRRELNGHPDLVIAWSRAERTRQPIGYVTLRTRHFPSDWPRRARCVKPDIDPGIFERDEKDSTPAEIEEAKRVCRGCSERLACLKSALETNDKIIRGAMTYQERRKLKPVTRQRLLRTIVIGGSR